MSRRGFRIAAVVFSTLATALLLEVFLWNVPRSLLPNEFKLLDRVYTARGAWEAMMEGDPYLGYRLKPDLDILFPSETKAIQYKTVRYPWGDAGFRDIGTKQPFDVVVVGDSFSLCDDVAAEDCWIRHLNDKTGLSWGTLGVNGYSTLAEERVLERYGMKFQPKLVILGIHPNDFKDNVNFDGWAKSGTDNLWVWLGAEHGRNEWGRTIANYSMLYRIFDGFTRSRGRPTHKFENENFNFVFRFDVWWRQVVKDTPNHPGFALMRESILRMKAMANAGGAEFAVMLFPTKEQVYWEWVRQFSKDPDAHVDQPVDTVKKFCDENGVACCVMTNELRGLAKQGQQLYHRINQHWNEAGNRVGADLIEACLTDKGILSKLKNAPAQAAN